MRTAKTRITKTNKKTRNQKGITLVALVVTIVVLIILAVISVQAVFSDSGIIKQAEKAAAAQANAEASDSEAMGEFEQHLINAMGGNGGSSGSEEEGGEENPPELPKGPNGKPLVTTLTEIQGTTEYAEDRLGNSVTIPVGFKVVAGENVQDGIVIEDDNITTYSDGTKSTGNQFVWIPVSNIDHSGNNKIIIEDEEGNTSEVEITLGRYTFAREKNADTGVYEDGTPTLVQKGSEYNATNTNNKYTINSYYTEKAVLKDDFEESKQVADLTGTNATAKDLKGFVESVRDNKGYYLARYEASYESGDTFGVGVAPEGKTYRKPASKISKYNSTSSMSYTAGTLWNYIRQGNASKVSRQMYYGNSFLESDLCNSYAWDTAIVYIQAMGNSNYANAGRGSNTTLLNTGETGDQKCHIYDMAGNEFEWTTEYSAYTNGSRTHPCVHRGGFYNHSYDYTSSRYRSIATYSDGNFSFRPLLYCNPVS